MSQRLSGKIAARRSSKNPPQRNNMKRRPSPPQATIVRLEQAQPIKPFGLDMRVLLTGEATGGAISVLMGWHKPGEGPPDHRHSASAILSATALARGNPSGSGADR